MFRRAYTARQLNHGEGMIFHPFTGERLDTLEFTYHGKQFLRRVPGLVVAWGVEDDILHYRPCIGGCGRKNYREGDSYPHRWIFDPFTGEKLS